MDKRILFGVAAIVAVVVTVGLVLVFATGDDEDDTTADATPTEVVADVPGEDEGIPIDDEATEEEVVEEEDGSEEAVDEEPDESIQLPTGDPERPQSDDMAYGFNIAWRADEGGEQFNRYTVQAVDTAGFNWVRIQVHWSEIQREPDWMDPLPIDRIVDVYEGSGIRIMITVVGAPEWARDPAGEQLLEDWETFASFMGFMANRYQGRVHAWGIWNEQNMASEVHGRVRASDYAYLLEAGYRGVKAGDENALVVFGGLAPTGVNDPDLAVNDVDYLEAFYLYGNGHYAQYFDVMGMHLNSTNNPPDTSYPSNPGPGQWTDHNSFYFLRGQDQRAVMASFGDDRPVWVTEFGWTTENMAEGYEYGADVSEEDQANFLAGAFTVAREEMPWITGMFVWNLNFSTLAPPEDEKFPWSVLNQNWSPRPSYTALQEMPKP
jgi:polysaccharide biosynthesis protein PslG